MKLAAVITTLITTLVALTAPALTISTGTASIRQYPEHGHLAFTGEIAEYFYVSAGGTYNIDIVSAGMPAGGEWPRLGLRVNSANRDEQVVNHADFKNHRFTVRLEAGTNLIGAAFLNDAYINGEDRNLLFDTISINRADGSASVSVSNEANWLADMGTRENQLVADTAQKIAQHRMGPAEVRVVDQNGQPLSGAQVSVSQRSHRFLFGANMFMFNQFGTTAQNDTYKNKFKDVFNYATVPFYWSFVEATKGQKNLALQDAMVAWCEQNGIAMKGHAVLYGEDGMMPSWNPDATDQLAEVSTILSRYKNRITNWDLVNEPFAAPGNIDLMAAHVTARALNPNDNLIINEYGQFYTGFQVFYANGHMALHDWLKNTVAPAGLPYDTIGIQAHAPVDTAFPLEVVTKHIDRFAGLGKRIHITEFAPCSNGQAVLGALWRGGTWTEAQQADYAEDFYRVAFANPNVDAITWWDFADTGAWLAGGGMLRSNLTEKPVYTALKNLIKNEWMTKTSGAANNGKLAFNGFYGDYDVNVTLNGETKTATLRLEPGKTGVATLSFTTAAPVPATAPISDTTAPVITISGGTTVYTPVFGSYTDAGATAVDNIDGNVAVSVENTVNTNITGAYLVYYRATDAAGNMSQKTRTVVVQDTVAPVVTLVGASSVSIKRNKTFTDPGANAVDAYDGACAVTRTGTVNTKTVGTYTLTYTATDKSGNTSSVKRTVRVTL